MGLQPDPQPHIPEPHFLVWKGVAYFPVLPAAAQAVMSLIVTEKGL